MKCKLVLSVFPGIDLLGRGFEDEGFCVVRGPDILWGGDIRTFHPPAGPWGGLIGGPPCQIFTRMRHLNPKCGQKYGNLIPEFERVVAEAQPRWFLMENVPEAPEPQVRFYWPVRSLVLNNRWFGAAQNRVRRFSFGVHMDVSEHGLDLDVSPDVVIFENGEYRQAVTSSLRAVPIRIGGNGKQKRTYTPDGRLHGPDWGQRESIAEMCEAQGLPAAWLDDCPLTAAGKREALGNGVPIAMSRAIAKAIRKAMEA